MHPKYERPSAGVFLSEALSLSSALYTYLQSLALDACFIASQHTGDNWKSPLRPRAIGSAVQNESSSFASWVALRGSSRTLFVLLSFESQANMFFERRRC